MKKISVGIDFAKEKFDVTLINVEDGTSEYSQFTNDRAGARGLLRLVKRFAKGTDSEEWIFCGEHTGCYSLTLAKFLAQKGMFLWMENPYVIGKCGGLKRGKDDKADSRMIAEYALRFADRARRYVVPPKSIEKMKTLLAARDLYVRQRKAAANFISEIPSGEREHSLVKSFKQTVEFLDKQIKEMEKEINAAVAEDESVMENYKILTSFPGVGMVNAVAMITFTQNFSKFDYNPRQIATFWGVSPFSKQSGSSVYRAPHVSGFCNHWLKALLSNAANVAIVYCPYIRAYYQRLKEKGKCEGVARNNVKNKLLHILTAMVKNKTMYNPDMNLCCHEFSTC